MINNTAKFFNGCQMGFNEESGPVIIIQVDLNNHVSCIYYNSDIEEIIEDLATEKNGFVIFNDNICLQEAEMAKIISYLKDNRKNNNIEKEKLDELKDCTNWDSFQLTLENIIIKNNMEADEKLKHSIKNIKFLYNARETGENSCSFVPFDMENKTLNHKESKHFNTREKLFNFILALNCKHSGALFHDEEITKFITGEDSASIKIDSKNVKDSILRKIKEIVNNNKKEIPHTYKSMEYWNHTR